MKPSEQIIELMKNHGPNINPNALVEAILDYLDKQDEQCTCVCWPHRTQR